MNRHPILIVGAGKIGQAVASILANSHDYQVYLSDAKKPLKLPDIAGNPVEFVPLDIQNLPEAIAFVKQHHIQGVVSCLPFHLTVQVAKLAEACDLHYFDPTEDVAMTAEVKVIAENSKGVFAPQCGLAPGFISIAANSLIQISGEVDRVKMRVGALAQNTSNSLHYNFTWSVDGLINEYIHPSLILEDGMKKQAPALGGREELLINGTLYEAFHTSGGAGSLVETYEGKVKSMDYKTLRYPGHCDRMRFLLQELHLRERPELLKEILLRSIPYTEADKVVVYVSVQGKKNGYLVENDYAHEFYPAVVAGQTFTAIQMTTASSICVVVDLVMHEQRFKGLLRQEQISLNEFLANRFGHYYAEKLGKAK